VRLRFWNNADLEVGDSASLPWRIRPVANLEICSPAHSGERTLAQTPKGRGETNTVELIIVQRYCFDRVTLKQVKRYGTAF
jgi:hypothetical protein